MTAETLFATLCAQRAPAAAAGLAILQNGEELHLSSDDAGQVSRAAREHTLRLPASCMVKPFSATTIMQLFEEMQLPLDSDVAALLGRSGGGFAEWGGITLRQLLDSTHGLDDPLSIAVAYPFIDGYIDLERLYSRLNAAPRLAAPGEMYSYSDAGMLVAAAIMERLCQRPFKNLINEQLLQKLDIDTGGVQICPTLGGALTISATDLLRLARYHMASGAPAALASMRAATVNFPGWTSTERSAAIGWNAYGDGWFGYMAMTIAGGYHLLRFHPERGTAIAIVSSSIPATEVLRTVFADLPELPAPPRPLFPKQVTELDTSVFAGRYERSALAADVQRLDDGRLRFSISNRDSTRPVLKQPIERALLMAENDAFYAVPLERNFIPHGQFIGRAHGSDRFNYLWSGRHVWRRVG